MKIKKHLTKLLEIAESLNIQRFYSSKINFIEIFCMAYKIMVE